MDVYTIDRNLEYQGSYANQIWRNFFENRGVKPIYTGNVHRKGSVIKLENYSDQSRPINGKRKIILSLLQFKQWYNKQQFNVKLSFLSLQSF